ncbi:MAG: hypothetical protein RIT81_40545 [Deltaproteobacteria bacterium]
MTPTPPKRPRRTFKVTLAYDGAAFFGFARQPDRTTVEGVLRAALEPIEASGLAVAGRTDRGVSATGQVISFHTRTSVTTETIRDVIDGAAPHGLAALNVEEVPRRFHAAFSARGRAYIYFVDSDVDATRVDRLLVQLLGRRDFFAFARDTPRGKSSVRHLHTARARRDGAQLRVELAADGFLRRQVRVLTATAIAAAEAGAPDDYLVALSHTRDRTRTANPLSAEGLYLTRVVY